MPITLPFDITAAPHQINAGPLQSNFQALAAKFNAGIADADIAASANISGAKIAVGTLPATRIVNQDITAAQIANTTITSAQIAAATITGGNIAATTILWGNLKFGSIDMTLSNPFVAGSIQTFNTGLLYANTRPLSLMIENTTLGNLGYLSYGVYHNTTGGDDRLSIYAANNSGGPIATTGVPIRLFYILLS